MSKKLPNSIEDLAALTQQEFLAVGHRLEKLEYKVDAGLKKAITDVLDVMRADLHDVKVALGPLVRTIASLEETVRHLDKRVVRLEEQAALK
jgi:hypothetical protein